jgi:hypothetical protein
MFGLNSSFASRREESFKALVPKASNHDEEV